MRFITHSTKEGHSTLIILILIMTLSLFFLSVSSLLRQNIRESQNIRQEWESRILKESIIKQVINRLEADPTPESHSTIDPLWDYISSLKTGEVYVELKDISSRLNPNFIRTKLLDETNLNKLIIDRSSPDRIRERRSKEGFCTNLNVWTEVFGEENLNRYFTLYSWANINITHEESLENLYRIRVGDAGAAAFRSRLQEGLREGRLWKTDELPQIMGSFSKTLYPVINCLPAINIHYIDPLLLESLLSYPYGGEILENYKSKTLTLLRVRKGAEIRPEELKNIIDPNENQLPVLEYLGTRTWFWELRIIINKKEFRSVISNYGEGWFIVE